MDSEDDLVREVYARFGLAVYAAQCLEHGVVTTMLYLHHVPSTRMKMTPLEWETEVDNFYSRNFKHTLGRMLLDLKKVVTLDDVFGKELNESLEMRNWLVHDYFRERAEDFMFHDGRVKMLLELEKAFDLIKNVDDKLSALIEPIRIKYGITDEVIDKISEEMILNARGGR